MERQRQHLASFSLCCVTKKKDSLTTTAHAATTTVAARHTANNGRLNEVEKRITKLFKACFREIDGVKRFHG
jgi:hypothetical protein